jgi:hypothetical protein
MFSIHYTSLTSISQEVGVTWMVYERKLCCSYAREIDTHTGCAAEGTGWKEGQQRTNRYGNSTLILALLFSSPYNVTEIVMVTYSPTSLLHQ